MVTLKINGKSHQIDVTSDMPVLWVLRDVLGMTGTRFGCGMALCGACTVQLDGHAIRSCVTPVSAAAGKAITTIQTIGTTPAGKKVQQAYNRLAISFHATPLAAASAVGA
jgi:isoquinoline 1-oxidoreductase subunit alpha